jgi:hypothetical protein
VPQVEKFFPGTEITDQIFAIEQRVKFYELLIFIPVTIHDSVDGISDIVTGTGDAPVKYIGLPIDVLLDLQKIVIVFQRPRAVGAIRRTIVNNSPVPAAFHSRDFTADYRTISKLGCFPHATKCLFTH